MSRTLRDKVGPPAAITLTRLAPFGCGGILTKYFYTGIRVRDLERSIQFYRKVMGMKVTRRGRMLHGGVWVELKSPDSPQRLELNWYPAGSKYFTPYRRGEELDHLSFRVSDVNRAFKEIIAKGARPEIEPFREERYEFAFASDPTASGSNCSDASRRDSRPLSNPGKLAEHPVEEIDSIE